MSGQPVKQSANPSMSGQGQQNTSIAFNESMQKTALANISW